MTQEEAKSELARAEADLEVAFGKMTKATQDLLDAFVDYEKEHGQYPPLKRDPSDARFARFTKAHGDHRTGRTLRDEARSRIEKARAMLSLPIP